LRPRDLETLELPRVLDAVAGYARSEAGRDAVRALVPTSDRDEAERRLQITADLLMLEADAGRVPTADVPLLALALADATPEGAALEARRLLDVRDVLGVSRRVAAHLRRDPGRFPVLAALADTLVDLRELRTLLARTLDESGQIREDASPTLAAARATCRELRARLEQRLLGVVRDTTHAEVVAEQYVTVRNGRYVVPIRAAAAWSFGGVVQDRSSSDETVFIEPLFAVELNNRLLLASKTEEAEERRVRIELTDAVRANADALAALEAALAATDAHGAVAAFAAAHRATRPTLGTRDVVLRAARHPLLELTHRTTVPIDLTLREDQRGLAITGPNAGGKTVALKTLGLSALLAQTGLFVHAADGARLPCFTAVLADIGDAQSIERDLSTFTAHATNLAVIAREVGAGALVLLDEPGAGTDPIEGAALATGVLTDLLERGPRVVFTTHFAAVKTFALAESTLEVAACDVDPETGVARYELVYHSIGQSFALPIARRHGIPARAVEIAERLLTGESRDLAGAIARLEASRRELDRAREETQREQARLERARTEAETLAADLRARQRQRWSDDLEESRRFLREIERKGRALLDELRARPEPGALRTFVRESTEAIATKAPIAATPAAAAPPKLGDTVEMVGGSIRGELVELHGDRARIQRGGLRFEVALAQLRVVADEPARRERVVVSVTRPPESDQERGEINLVGQRVREAIDALAAFLDRSVRLGLSEVRVVHGVGTGTLRRAIQEFLAASPYCAKFREEDSSRGGGSVTLVELC
jgi:DNA mismatch repair protein MutS2